MTGFRTAIKNVRLKSDPDGKVHLVRVHKLVAGQRKAKHAKAARQEKAWREAEHDTPIAKEDDKA